MSNGEIKDIDGIPVIIEGYESFHFFVSAIEIAGKKIYIVFEKSTGVSVSNPFPSKKRAIENAKQRIDQYCNKNPEELKKRLEALPNNPERIYQNEGYCHE